MLRIRSTQIKHFDNKMKQDSFNEMKGKLRVDFEQQISKKHPDAPSFENWFNAQLEQCQKFAITQSVNIRSYCSYGMAFFPDFPGGFKFKSCSAVLKDTHYDENEKLDKVNYRLLFIRR